jgi:pimeloyl-ACP methyl ester carboxylesterase
VLLITGGNSERGAIVTPEAAAQAQRLCPTIEVVQLEQAGHNIRREAFDEFVAAVTDFLIRAA